MNWGPKTSAPIPLLPEAASLLEQRLAMANSIHARVDAMVRSVRASLISKKLEIDESLYGFATNCIGSVYWLTRVAEEYGLLVEPAIVLRQPWQEPAACREIHTVGIVRLQGTQEVIVGDAMPDADYSFGTTTIGTLHGTDLVVVRDAVLQRDCFYRILSPAMFSMVVQIFEAEVMTDTAQTTAKLWEAHHALGIAPSYQVRALWKLSRYTSQYEKAMELLLTLSPHAMRRSYAKWLPLEIEEKVTELREAQERRQREMLPLVERAIAGAKNLDARNYWLTVQRVFSGDTFVDKKHNPRAYLPDSKYPIHGYERAISSQNYAGYGAAKSNLYTCDWEKVPDIKLD